MRFSGLEVLKFRALCIDSKRPFRVLHAYLYVMEFSKLPFIRVKHTRTGDIIVMMLGSLL
jgi:hypothetical protein